MRILGIFTTLVYLRPNLLITQGTLRNLSNMYNGVFSTETCVTQVHSELKAYSEPCQICQWWQIYSLTYVTLAYLEQWHIQTPKHIQNTAKHLSLNILFKSLCNLEIFWTLVYSELWYIVKWAYLCWQEKLYSEPYRISKMDILLKNPCNYSRFKGPIHSKLLYIQNPCVSATTCIKYHVSSIMYQVRKTNVLLYPLIELWATQYSFLHSLLYIQAI